MKQSVVGILAHVDAGKTTLTEAMMYLTGTIRDIGRVDAGSAHLDFDPIEKARGITVYSAQTDIVTDSARLTLLDTPGHADLSSEMERALTVMDCAVIVISGTSGVESHTQTVWELAARYSLPVFVFVTKMDMPTADKASVIRDIKSRLSPNCTDLTQESAIEEAALSNESALSEYLETGTLKKSTVSSLILERKVFPVFFGSGLKLTGVDALIDALCDFAGSKPCPEEFSARVYKIARDSKGVRMTLLKLTGGTLEPRTLIEYTNAAGESVSEKVQEIRLLSGGKYTQVSAAKAFGLYAVTGLTGTYSLMGLGAQEDHDISVSEPVFRYRVRAVGNTDRRALMDALNILTEEEPSYAAVYEPAAREFRVGLMGDIQAEVFLSVLKSRFGIDAAIDEGRILYRETVTSPVYGAGHFEPLRHYAEVRLLIEPMPRGSGLSFRSAVDTDTLPVWYQAQIFSALRRKRHRGTLTGSLLTDVRITLIAGRAHLAHTEGGDFYQAVSRAVRQALMTAKENGHMALLEPYYGFELSLPVELSGRALSDISRMGGTADAPVHEPDTVRISGKAPASALRSYPKELTAYTRGRGRISLYPCGYEAIFDPSMAVADIGYDALRDTDNPAESVFTSRGGSLVINWNEVEAHMHTESPAAAEARPVQAHSRTVSDAELERIMLRTVGEIKRPLYASVTQTEPVKQSSNIKLNTVEAVFVDGYNLIFAWDGLKALAKTDLEGARLALLDILTDYRAFVGIPVTVVFDAYMTERSSGEPVQYRGLDVVYTKKDEPADVYIAKALSAHTGKYRVRVITSDNLIKLGALSSDALMTGAPEFKLEVEHVSKRIDEIIKQRQTSGSAPIIDRL